MNEAAVQRLGSPTRLRLACARLRRGQVVAHPTEAVFGLGCDPTNPRALARLLRAKRRPAHKGFVVIAAERAQLRKLVRRLDAVRMARVSATWPGPHTWILPAARGVHPLLSGSRGSVAVRVTAHPLAAALCRGFGGAIVSSSANRTGREPLRSALEVRRALRGRVDFVLDGALGRSERPSSIHDARTGAQLR